MRDHDASAPERSVLWSIGMPASCSRAGPEPTWCEADQVGAVPSGALCVDDCLKTSRNEPVDMVDQQLWDRPLCGALTRQCQRTKTFFRSDQERSRGTDLDHAGASPRVLWSDPEQQAEQCRLLWGAPGLIGRKFLCAGIVASVRHKGGDPTAVDQPYHFCQS